jgi:hypothetical protein
VNRKEAVVRAILDLHLQRALDAYPVPQTDAYVASARAHVETYRSYAEQEADAVLAALDNLKSEEQ